MCERLDWTHSLSLSTNNYLPKASCVLGQFSGHLGDLEEVG